MRLMPRAAGRRRARLWGPVRALLLRARGRHRGVAGAAPAGRAGGGLGPCPVPPELSAGHAPDWDSAVLDVAALVAAVRCDDAEGVAVILRHGCAAEMLSVAAKLLAEVADELGATVPAFREWAQVASERP